ncbi:MAG: NAD(+)/NADH kinase [Patescibacteria group bacterium]
MKSAIKKLSLYYRPDIPEADRWKNKITGWLGKNYPKIRIDKENCLPKTNKDAPDLLVVLGGDGTIIEAAQKYQRSNPLILGLNLGHVGFLAAIRSKKDFILGVKKVLGGHFHTFPRLMIKTTLIRKNKNIFSAYAMNDVTVQSLFGMVNLKISIAGHPVQFIHGNGALISTATGSTAYNLSAHGPIIMPDIKCMVLTELLDHGIPTPSIVIKRNQTITIDVEDFRKRDRFLIRESGDMADVILAADVERIIALKKGDKIIVKKSDRFARFAELEKNYFFKSIQEKFAFR